MERRLKEKMASSLKEGGRPTTRQPSRKICNYKQKIEKTKKDGIIKNRPKETVWQNGIGQRGGEWGRIFKKTPRGGICTTKKTKSQMLGAARWTEGRKGGVKKKGGGNWA